MARGEGFELTVTIGGERIRSCTHLGDYLAVRVGRRILGFAPQVADGGRSALEVVIYRLRSMEPGSLKGAKELSRVSTPIGTTRPLPQGLSDVPVRIKIGGPARCGGAGHGGRCCVTCDKVTACGCAVSMSCGSCCAGECC